ncbi:MAG: alpha/beta hydrolase [Candidatus Omnitrophica bacterium]|nr:alpha/beta hydrolase [Candidatus Omnitrophota bacterium]
MPETLLFLHGWASDFKIWHKQRGYFKGCEIIAPQIDLETLGQNADKVYALCKTKKDIVIVAWSMGWLVALKLLEYKKIDIKAMVSIAGTPKFISEDYIQNGVRRSEVRALRLALKKDFIPALNRFYAQHKIPLNAADFFFRKDSLIRQLDILEKEDLRKNLGLIKCPVLFIGGAGDMLCPIEIQNYMASCVNNSVVAIMKNSAHAPFLEEDKEVGRLIYAFTNNREKVFQGGF